MARASAVFLRRGEQPPGNGLDVTGRDAAASARRRRTGRWQTPLTVWAYGKEPGVAGPSFDLTQWQHDGPKFVWVRDVKPLVDGEPMTAFTRAAMAGDVASSLTHYGTEGLYFINADYTVTLSRLPVGPDIGLVALTHSSHAGVATGTAAMFDHTGLIGTATATTLANPGFTPRSMRLAAAGQVLRRRPGHRHLGHPELAMVPAAQPSGHHPHRDPVVHHLIDERPHVVAVRTGVALPHANPHAQKQIRVGVDDLGAAVDRYPAQRVVRSARPRSSR